MIMYLVSATRQAGVRAAMERGWTRIAASRFATAEKHDVRVITRASELVPLSGVTLLIKGDDYEAGPAAEDTVAFAAWAGDAGQKFEFDRFVLSGRGRWIEDTASAALGGRDAGGAGAVPAF